MKRRFIFGILGMMLPMIAQAQDTQQTDQKIFVEPNQIAFANGGIFAYIEGEWIALESIHSETSGLLAAIKKNPNIDRWRCSYCGFNNNSWDEACQNILGNKPCGRPRPW